MPGTIQPLALLDHYEPHTPPITTIDLASLPAHPHLDRLDIEICSLWDLAKQPKGLKKRSVNEAMALKEMSFAN